ncbi:lasso RiPP family leader peptide-containing protein [Thiocapsa sp.]|uniref:lasso RiPP family leader peptide-containing protein n=1 Tax=Thiocapsa sp. TaxID=2024551 RepID=UPI0039C996B6
MTHTTDDQKAPVRRTDAMPYHAPKLLKYGRLRELTAGQAGSILESVAGKKGKNTRPG